MSRDFTIQPDNLKISIKGKFRCSFDAPPTSFEEKAVSLPTRLDSPTRILDDNGLYDGRGITE